MSSFNSNFMAYNIVTENELSQVLSQYDTNYVIDVVEDAMKSRYNEVPIVSTRPNVVYAWEQNFRGYQAYYGSDSAAQIAEVRTETYNEIISTICKEFNLNFTIDDAIDLYSAASYLYDFLVCKFSDNMVSFFANYICKEKNTIFDALNMNELRKNKDTSTIYNKKIYKDNKLAIINANIDMALSYISSIDIPFYTIVYTIFGANSDVANYILSIISSEDNNFYHKAYTDLLNTDIRAEIITAIRIKINDIAVSHEMINNIEDITSKISDDE